MRTWLWRPALSRRADAHSLLARIVVLALVGVLLAGLFLLGPASAQAQGSQYASRGHQTPHTVYMRAATGGTRLDTFMVGGDGFLHHKWYDWASCCWAAWELVPTVGMINWRLVGKPTAVSWGPGRLDVFARASDGGLAHIWFDNGQWSAWENLGGVSLPPDSCWWGCASISSYFPLMSAPAVTSWGPGRLDVFAFARPEQPSLYHRWFDHGSWSNWEFLGSGYYQNDPAAVSWGPGRVDLFARGGVNELLHKWFDQGHWSSSWESLGGILTASPTAGSWEPGNVDVFVRNANDGLSHLWFWGAWSAWEDLGGSFLGSPAVATWGYGYWDIFARGTDQTLVHKWYNNGTWTGWESLGGVLASDPAALTWDTVVPTSSPPIPPPRCGVPGKPPCPQEP